MRLLARDPGTALYVVTDDLQRLDGAVRRHLPESAVRHIDKCSVCRSTIDTPTWTVESYNRNFAPLTATIGTRDGDSVEIRIRYDDGRSHVEAWQYRTGRVVEDDDGVNPPMWAAGFE